MWTENLSHVENAKKKVEGWVWLGQKKSGGQMGVFEPRIEVIVQMQNKQKIGGGGGGGGVLSGWGQCGCKPRIEVILKMKKSRGSF